MSRRLVFSGLSLAWIALIWHLSSQPGLDVTPLFAHQDKLMHVAAYAVLALFIYGALQRPGDTRMFLLITAVVLAGLYGIVDEYHQGFVPGRHSSLADVLANFTGSLLGAACMRLLLRLLDPLQAR